MKIIICSFVVLSFVLGGCSSLGNRKSLKTTKSSNNTGNLYTNLKIRTTIALLAGGLGAGIGMATAPSDEKPEFHAMGWAGILGVLGFTLGELFFNDRKEYKKLKSEFDAYKKTHDFIQIDEKHGFFNDPNQPQEKKPVIWKIHKGLKLFKVSPTKIYKAEVYLTIEKDAETKPKVQIKKGLK